MDYINRLRDCRTHAQQFSQYLQQESELEPDWAVVDRNECTAVLERIMNALYSALPSGAEGIYVSVNSEDMHDNHWR
jgi:hypothetical protein